VYLSIPQQLSPKGSLLLHAEIAQLRLSDHDTYEWCGTGWRVDDDLIVTNRHVDALFAQRQGSTFKYRLNQLGKQVRARIDFREEYCGPESEEYGVAEILWIADESDSAPDMAVLRAKTDPGLPEPLSIIQRNAVTEQDIAVVGYPAKDSRGIGPLRADTLT
jgi:endonuclease G